VLPFSEDKLENYILKLGRPRHGVRRLDSPETKIAREFGEALFETVFYGDVRGCYKSSLDQARKNGRGLRIRLNIEEQDLIGIPWEYLYSEDQEPGFLALSTFTPILRYVERPHPILPLEIEPPLNILVMTARPRDCSPLNIDRERANLERALGRLWEQEKVNLTWLDHGNLRGLRGQMRRDTYHIFHFIGHGTFDEHRQEGSIVLENNEGYSQIVSGQQLASTLESPFLRLVILNACEGARTSKDDPLASVAASLVRAQIPAVVAMQFEITDEAAVTFADEFYAALADNCPVDEAITEARKAIHGEGNDIEWGTPVLYMRALDGNLFTLPPQLPPTEEQLKDILLSETRWEKRRDAVVAHGLSERKSISVLGKALLTDPRSEVKCAAAQALGTCDDDRALEYLTQGLTDSNWKVRKASVEAIGQIRSVGNVVGALRTALEDIHPSVQEKAAEALMEVGDIAALEALKNTLLECHKKMDNLETRVSEIADEVGLSVDPDKFLEDYYRLAQTVIKAIEDIDTPLEKDLWLEIYQDVSRFHERINPRLGLGAGRKEVANE